ncbi:MAG: hypothetical protein ACWA44_06670 [Thiotrichales bacterium]
MRTSSSLVAVMLAVVLVPACSTSPMKSGEAGASISKPAAKPSPLPEPGMAPPLIPPAPVANKTAALPVETAIDFQMICTLGEDIRRIENINTLEGGCQLDYEKSGKVKTVATAREGSEFCQQVLERIQANLEKAGFVCEH